MHRTHPKCRQSGECECASNAPPSYYRRPSYHHHITDTIEPSSRCKASGNRQCTGYNIRSATPHYVCVSRESQTSVSSLFSFSAFTSAFAFCRYGCHISHMSSQPYSHTEITVTVTKPNNEAQSAVVHPALIPYSLSLPYCSPINRLLSPVSLLVQ